MNCENFRLLFLNSTLLFILTSKLDKEEALFKFNCFPRSKMPAVQRLKTSRTWTDEMLYGPTNIRKEIHHEAREEL